jgi:CubicO group peptidase (beta-lactamase class C family)/D-alanyl-D-alanine dipeptidase
MQRSIGMVTFLFSFMVSGVAAAHAAEPNAPAAKEYETLAAALEKMIQHEMAEKGLPAVSIALVDDQKIVWSKGYGYADPAARKRATAQTVYRVGSVSKLFTDLAVMQLVERGTLDLDAPITRYLPDFKPANPFGIPITLRMLMSHRSGLVRESPVGNYFDPDEPSLAKTVLSLNRTELVYAPEMKTKYSNAGLATVGFVLEETQKKPFAKYLYQTLLDPLDMKHSRFEKDPALLQELAKAQMWTYPGRQFDAPTFELGMAPAGCMYTTVEDLGRFLRVLFARGKGPHGQILKPETLESMWKPQFAKPDDKQGFGLGFMVTEFEGRRRIGHSGAIYGFATDLSALPDDKLGVIVVSSLDCSNAVTTHIADEALRHMLALKQKKPLPEIVQTAPLKPARAKELAGRYKTKDRIIDLAEHNGHLYLLPAHGGFRQEIRALGDHLIVDDRLAYGGRMDVKDGKLHIGSDVFERVATAKPAPAPAKWSGLLGEYGWDHNTLIIFEKDGQLCSLIEWFFVYPLKEESENVFAFPDFGLYMGEKLIFTRDPKGRATQVEAAKVVFARRKLDGENGETFRIKPVRPVAELRKEALAAKPPPEGVAFLPPDLVELTKLNDTIKLDIRYATDNNFLSTPLYTSAKAFMQKPAAEAVVRAHKKLNERGYGLLIHDAYRPWAVTKMFWDATPERLHLFVADPSKGSRHNRGCAVDLTLFDVKTGKPIEMVGGYDEMSDRSYPEYFGGTSLQRWHRELLRQAMESEGFTVYDAEWWHFDYKDWRKYGILNKTFEELEKGNPKSEIRNPKNQ